MYMEEMTRFQVGEDSPVFSNMFKYCQVTPPPNSSITFSRWKDLQAPRLRSYKGVRALSIWS